MSEINIQTTCFHKAGPHNSARTLELAAGRARELGIQRVLVATTMGDTGVTAAQMMPEKDVIVVTHSTGFVQPNHQELTDTNRAAIEAAGAKILTCQHAFGGVNRAVRKQFDTTQLDELVAHMLRMWGQGMKVVVEMALMAADAGLVRTDELVMCIAGTGRGADTAVVLRPVNAQAFFDLRFIETVCRPVPEHPEY